MAKCEHGRIDVECKLCDSYSLKPRPSGSVINFLHLTQDLSRDDLETLLSQLFCNNQLVGCESITAWRKKRGLSIPLPFED